MRVSVRILALGLLTALAGASARADYFYNYEVDQATITVLPGDTAVVNVYLIETVTGGDALRLSDATQGLVSAGVRLTFGATAPVRVVAPGDITPNAAFNSPFTSVDLPGDGTAGIYELLDFGFDPILATVTSPTTSRLFLGSFVFTGLAEGADFDVIVGDFSADFVETATSQGIGIDDPTTNILSTSFRVISITSVPEPGSLALFLLGSGATVIAYRKRRRKV